jgi:hypothetical protein
VPSAMFASFLGSTSQSSSSANLQLGVQLNSTSETSGQNLSLRGSAGSMHDIVRVI